MAPTPPPPVVVVAVVSWNTRELLDECLRALRPEVEGGQAEVWVVDNASSDGSAELVRDRHPWATVVESGANLGSVPPSTLSQTAPPRLGSSRPMPM